MRVRIRWLRSGSPVYQPGLSGVSLQLLIHNIRQAREDPYYAIRLSIAGVTARRH